MKNNRSEINDKNRYFFFNLLDFEFAEDESNKLDYLLKLCEFEIQISNIMDKLRILSCSYYSIITNYHKAQFDIISETIKQANNALLDYRKGNDTDFSFIIEKLGEIKKFSNIKEKSYEKKLLNHNKFVEQLEILEHLYAHLGNSGKLSKDEFSNNKKLLEPLSILLFDKAISKYYSANINMLKKDFFLFLTRKYMDKNPPSIPATTSTLDSVESANFADQIARFTTLIDNCKNFEDLIQHIEKHFSSYSDLCKSKEYYGTISRYNDKTLTRDVNEKIDKTEFFRYYSKLAEISTMYPIKKYPERILNIYMEKEEITLLSDATINKIRDHNLARLNYYLSKTKVNANREEISNLFGFNRAQLNNDRIKLALLLQAIVTNNHDEIDKLLLDKDFDRICANYYSLIKKEVKNSNSIVISKICNNEKLSKPISRDVFTLDDIPEILEQSPLKFPEIDRFMRQFFLNDSRDSITQEEKNKNLLVAVNNNNIKKIEHLISNGANLNLTLKPETLLHYAITHNDLEMAKIFLRNGINIDSKSDDRNITPLNLAVELDHKLMIELLLSYGANIDLIPAKYKADINKIKLNLQTRMAEFLEEKPFNIFELFYSRKNRNIYEIFHERTGYGLNIEIPIDNQNISYPLLDSVTHLNLDNLKYLIKIGADLTVTSKNESILTILKKHETAHDQNPNPKYIEANTLLFNALTSALGNAISKKNTISSLKLISFIQHNFSKNDYLLAPQITDHINNSENTPHLHNVLLMAIQENNLEAVDFLLSKSNCDIKYQDNDGKGFLDYAISAKNEKILELLIKKGAIPNENTYKNLDINYKKLIDRCSLDYAVEMKNSTKIYDLILRGVQTDNIDKMDIEDQNLVNFINAVFANDSSKFKKYYVNALPKLNDKQRHLLSCYVILNQNPEMNEILNKNFMDIKAGNEYTPRDLENFITDKKSKISCFSFITKLCFTSHSDVVDSQSFNPILSSAVSCNQDKWVESLLKKEVKIDYDLATTLTDDSKILNIIQTYQIHTRADLFFAPIPDKLIIKGEEHDPEIEKQRLQEQQEYKAITNLQSCLRRKKAKENYEITKLRPDFDIHDVIDASYIGEESHEDNFYELEPINHPITKEPRRGIAPHYIICESRTSSDFILCV